MGSSTQFVRWLKDHVPKQPTSLVDDLVAYGIAAQIVKDDGTVERVAPEHLVNFHPDGSGTDGSVAVPFSNQQRAKKLK